MEKLKKNSDFSENDWSHLHDCMYDLTGNNLNKNEMIDLFNKLPENLRTEAYHWGMADTIWCNNFCNWFEKNLMY